MPIMPNKERLSPEVPAMLRSAGAVSQTLEDSAGINAGSDCKNAGCAKQGRNCCGDKEIARGIEITTTSYYERGHE